MSWSESGRILPTRRRRTEPLLIKEIATVAAGAGAATAASALVKKLSLPGGSYVTNSFDALAVSM